MKHFVHDSFAPPPSGRMPSPARRTDVAIIGGGLAGSLAAVVLARAGQRVVLIDRHASCPSQFRVEKIAGEQIELLRRLKLLGRIAERATRYDQVVNVHRGRVIDRTYGEQYGIMYADLVKVVRAELTSSVEFIVDAVAHVETGADHQRIDLAGGGSVEARLVVLATGMSDLLRHELGIRRRMICEKHSVSFGFSILPAAGEIFGFPALTSYGERPSDGIDYLTLFPLDGIMRANLFTFIDYRDPWAATLRRQPRETLYAAMPGLIRFLGDFDVVEKVENWVMDLYVAENHVRDGVVLIGDAFQTSCPAAGTGVSRLLTDVERLCTMHAPRWLATPGMGAEKIAQFYDDPVKRSSDARALRLAHFRRSLSIDEGLGWSFRRRQGYLRRRLVGWARELRKTQARPALSQQGVR